MEENVNKKPVKLWLFFWSTATGLIAFLAPEKTAPLIVACLLIIFILLAIPIWNFWWIEHSKWRRLLAYLVLSGSLCIYGVAIWPKSPAACIEAGILNYRTEVSPIEIIAPVTNCGPEIPDDVEVYLGFQKPEKGNLFWRTKKSKILYPIGNSKTETFAFLTPDKPVDAGTAMPIALVSEKFKDGFVTDTTYTWDYLKSAATVRGRGAFIDPNQIQSIKDALKVLKICMQKNGVENHQACFPAD